MDPSSLAGQVDPDLREKQPQHKEGGLALVLKTRVHTSRWGLGGRGISLWLTVLIGSVTL